MEPAIGRWVWRIERECVSDHDASPAHGVGECGVGVGLAQRIGCVEAIGFRKHHVECNHPGAHLAKPGDQPGNHLAAPRPLADRGEAALVDVNNGNGAGGLRPRKRPKQSVVDATIEMSEERRIENRESDRHQRRAHPTQQH